MKDVGTEETVDIGEVRHHIVDADVEPIHLEVPDRKRPQPGEADGHAGAGGDDDRRPQAFDLGQSVDAFSPAGGG